MARSTGREPDSFTTTLRLAGEPNTSLVYSAYKIEQREHYRLVLCFTRIQGVLKGATRASPRNRLTLLFYLWRAPSDLNRDTPYDATNSFQDYFLSQLGLDAHLVDCAFKTNTIDIIILLFIPLAVGATSFGLPCISQSRNSRLCLAGNATREKMHSLGSLLGLYVSKTPPVPHRSQIGFCRRWFFLIC